jgi:FMN-dependent NADH-azoreductase
MSQNVINRVLRIDSSAQQAGSISRAIGDEVVRRLQGRHPGLELVELDLAGGMGHIDGDWVGASFTAEEERSAAQRQRLAASDEAVAAVEAADAIVLTVPMYNFSVPSVLKAWIDHLCRAGLTFRYTENGPQGLLADRPLYLVMASGGVPFGSPMDFASGYLRQVFRFIGIEDVRLIGAERVAADAEAAKQAALTRLNEWLPEPVGRVA